MSRNSPSGRTKAFAEAALCFEITASIAGLRNTFTVTLQRLRKSVKEARRSAQPPHTHTHTP